MRRLATFITVIAALVVASSASAKGPVDMDVCGSSGCKTFRWSETGGGGSGIVIGLINADALEFAPSPPPGPFYELNAKADWLEQTTIATRFFYVPGANTLRAGSNWLQPDKHLTAALTEATRGLKPFPRPTLARVLVNGHAAPNPAVYEALLGELGTGKVVPDLGRRIEIVLRSERPSPWTSVLRPLEYFPRVDLVHRHVEWFSVPPRVAEQIEDDAGIVAVAADSRSKWPGYLAATSLLIGLITVVALNLRARRRVRPASTV